MNSLEACMMSVVLCYVLYGIVKWGSSQSSKGVNEFDVMYMLNKMKIDLACP